jgi:hypothetical protein
MLPGLTRSLYLGYPANCNNNLPHNAQRSRAIFFFALKAKGKKRSAQKV